MANILFSTIDVNGSPECCKDSLGGRTDEAITGDAALVSPGKWMLFNPQAPGDAGSNPDAEAPAELGTVEFGLCCATEIVLTLEGEIETLNTGYDSITVRLNGGIVYTQSSVSTTADPWDKIAITPFDVTIPLTPQACGNIITITGDNVDDTANNDVWWTAEIKSIT